MSETSTKPALRGALCGLAAAALFGMSAPICKLLLDAMPPPLLAGLLYLGAALGLWVVRAFRRATSEAPLRREDAPKLLAVILSGGIVAPVLMLFGLERLSGLTGSLLLNLEAPFTILVAVLIFREHLGLRVGLATLCILAGAMFLKLEPGTLAVDGLGMVLIAAACLCWAIDNNLTQRLSLRDPFAVVRIKTTGAGIANITLALLWLRPTFPSWGMLGAALLVGCLSYGVSVVLDAYALRFVGAAREAAYFASAPFLGGVLSVLLLGESLRWVDGLAMTTMALGVMLLLRERHGHRHVHHVIDHEHAHVHDEHHQHAHTTDVALGEPHSHVHHHEALDHEHAHVPDLHHRHRHD